jgi:hypothetical protein
MRVTISRCVFGLVVFLNLLSLPAHGGEPATQSVIPTKDAAALWDTARAAFGLPGAAQATPKEKLPVRLDAQGPYLILATERASAAYGEAIAKAKELHPTAAFAIFAPGDLPAMRKALSDHHPYYALLFILPDELDVNFAWQWLTACTQVNDDPLVDVRTGFITGQTPADAVAFVERIAAAVNGRAALPGLFVDNFGPNPQAGKSTFEQQPGNFMIPVLGQRLGISSISHGTAGFTDERLGTMAGAGLIHFGGHGHPECVDDGLRGAQASALRLAPCVAFNGACYTGVTGRWYDQWTADGRVAERIVDPADSFCLNFLKSGAVAYLAALHPDHGMPVYQEMEYLAYSGASLGDVMKHTHDGVIIAAGGQVPAFERLAGGMPAPQWSPAEMMLKGTAARVLFGDPSMIVMDAFTEPPFKIAMNEADHVLHVMATLANPALKSSYTDTYHADLSRNRDLFNDRALIDVDLPKGWDAVARVEVMEAKAPGGRPLKYRLVGYAVAHDQPGHRLRVQVDVPSDGYLQSAFRAPGATVELRVSRSR